MKINDISVSRLHSKLKFNFEQKSLLIKDCGSKFGTLVLIKNPFELREKEFLEMQVGRSVVSAKVIKGDRKKIFGFKKVNDKVAGQIQSHINQNDCSDNDQRLIITEQCTEHFLHTADTHVCLMLTHEDAADDLCNNEDHGHS